MMRIHQIFSLTCSWSKHIMWPNIPQLKLGNIWEYSPIFKFAPVAENIWMRKIFGWEDNKHNRFHLAGKYACIFVLEHYLFLHTSWFLEAQSFPRATLSENCPLMSMDEYPRIFSRQMEAIVYVSGYQYSSHSFWLANCDFGCGKMEKRISGVIADPCVFCLQMWILFSDHECPQA